MDRVLIIIRALACAIAAAAFSTPVLGLVDPLIREATLTFLMGNLLTALGGSSGPQEAAAVLEHVLHDTPLAIYVAPVTIAALFGELTRTYSWFWYACCSGLIGVVILLEVSPWPSDDDSGATADAATAMAQNRFMLLYFLVGLVAGTIYWLIAGRDAGGDLTELERRTA